MPCLSVPTVNFAGASVSVQGTDAAASTVVGNGTVSFGSAATLDSLKVAGGTLQTGDLTVTGMLTWTGGTMVERGQRRRQGPGTGGGGSHVLDGRTLINPGAATWTAGTLYLSDGAVLENTGTLDDQAGADMVAYLGATPSLVNSGLFQVEACSGTYSQPARDQHRHDRPRHGVLARGRAVEPRRGHIDGRHLPDRREAAPP